MSIDWSHFTPWSSLAGGLLIGIAAAMLLLLNGRVAGSIVACPLHPRRHPLFVEVLKCADPGATARARVNDNRLQ